MIKPETTERVISKIRQNLVTGKAHLITAAQIHHLLTVYDTASQRAVFINKRNEDLEKKMAMIKAFLGRKVPTETILKNIG